MLSKVNNMEGNYWENAMQKPLENRIFLVCEVVWVNEREKRSRGERSKRTEEMCP